MATEMTDFKQVKDHKNILVFVLNSFLFMLMTPF